MELIVFVSTVIVFAIDRHSIHLISSLDKKEPIHIGLFYMLTMPDHIRDYFHSKSFTLAAIGTVFVFSIIGNVYFLNAKTNTASRAEGIERGDFFSGGGREGAGGVGNAGSGWQNGQYTPNSGYPGSAQGAAPPPASGPLTIGGTIGGVPQIGNNSQPSYGNGQQSGLSGNFPFYNGGAIPQPAVGTAPQPQPPVAQPPVGMQPQPVQPSNGGASSGYGGVTIYRNSNGTYSLIMPAGSGYNFNGYQYTNNTPNLQFVKVYTDGSPTKPTNLLQSQPSSGSNNQPFGGGANPSNPDYPYQDIYQNNHPSSGNYTQPFTGGSGSSVYP